VLIENYTDPLPLTEKYTDPLVLTENYIDPLTGNYTDSLTWKRNYTDSLTGNDTDSLTGNDTDPLTANYAQSALKSDVRMGGVKLRSSLQFNGIVIASDTSVFSYVSAQLPST
jgi:hypothetical protein